MEDTAHDIAVDAAWRTYDTDGSGVIDSSELAALAAALGAPLSDDELREALDVLDTDDNGTVDKVCTPLYPSVCVCVLVCVYLCASVCVALKHTRPVLSFVCAVFVSLTAVACLFATLPPCRRSLCSGGAPPATAAATTLWTACGKSWRALRRR